MDISEAVNRSIQYHFPENDPADVFQILARYGEEAYEKEVERVRLAILELSEGSFEKLIHFTRRAKEDYRDVLFWNQGDV